MNDLKERIKHALRSSNTSQSEAARHIGVSPQSVYKWVKTGHIDKENLQALADLTGFNVEWLLSGSGKRRGASAEIPADLPAPDLERQLHLLGQALGECIAAAGITRAGVALTGPELLMFADDLKRFLAKEWSADAGATAEPEPLFQVRELSCEQWEDCSPGRAAMCAEENTGRLQKGLSEKWAIRKLYAQPISQPTAIEQNGRRYDPELISRLFKALEDAAESLEIISTHSGLDSRLATTTLTRNYAASRALAARASIAAYEFGSVPVAPATPNEPS